MKIGDKLYCINHYFYESNRITFTKGKHYPIIHISEYDDVSFVDDEGDEWGFEPEILNMYFQPKFIYGK